MNKREFEIKQATIYDLDDITPIFDQYRVFYKQESDLDGAKQFLFEKLEHRESVIFMAKDLDDGQVVGFTQLYPIFSSISMQRAWILNDLYVIEGIRSQGVARGLMNQARDYAIATRAKGIQLSTALDNVRAQKLYESLNYERDVEYYHYYLTL